MTQDTDAKDVAYWRQQAEESDRHKWYELCEKSYFAHFDECPHQSHKDRTVGVADLIRCDEIHDGKLMFHVDAEEPDHPLDKKAWIWGIPVEVTR